MCIRDSIIPEFPVKANIPGRPNLSNKIDYLAVCPETNRVFLIELKTDNSSIRKEQDEYLELAAQNNVIKLIDGVLEIQNASNSPKYNHLMAKLDVIGWVDKTNNTNTSRDYEIQVVYIKPTKTLEDEKKQVITFEDIISALSDRNDALTTRFIKSLESWKADLKKSK
jgi:hypothetical protein